MLPEAEPLPGTTPTIDDEEAEEEDDEEPLDTEPTLLTGLIADSNRAFGKTASSSNGNRDAIVRLGSNFVRRTNPIFEASLGLRLRRSHHSGLEQKILPLFSVYFRFSTIFPLTGNRERVKTRSVNEASWENIPRFFAWSSVLARCSLTRVSPALAKHEMF